MIDAFAAHTMKVVFLTGTSISSLLLATSDVVDERVFGVSIQTVRELGSFGLIALLVLSTLRGLKSLLPIACNYFEKTRDGFLGELKLERELREKSADAFREMLQSHKSDLGLKMGEVKDAIETGNKISLDLVNQLKGRPCQK